VRRTGESTRLFHAIVALGLGAAAAGCGGQTVRHPEPDASEETPDASSGPSILGGDDASIGFTPSGDAGGGAPDAGSDGWIPRPPVIA
jgi:hypothetical protein